MQYHNQIDCRVTGAPNSAKFRGGGGVADLTKGVTKNFEFLRDKNINFLEVLPMAIKKDPHFKNFCAFKRSTFYQFYAKRLKKTYFLEFY